MWKIGSNKIDLQVVRFRMRPVATKFTEKKILRYDPYASSAIYTSEMKLKLCKTGPLERIYISKAFD